MTKLTTLVAASLLGLSSIASAKPISVDVHAGASVHVAVGTPAPAPAPHIVVRDHRADAAPLAASVPVLSQTLARRPAWSGLGMVRTGKQVLRVGDRALDSLRLVVDGKVRLERVAIYYADNGQVQVIDYRGTIADDQPMPIIELAGQDRKIEKIVIRSTGGQRAAIRVMGRNDSRRAAASPLSGWTKLGAVTTGRQVLELTSAKSFDAVALAATGKVHLSHVVITFANGTQQRVMFDETLTAGSALPMIDLVGKDRDIAKILVVSDGALRGELALYAI